MLSSEKTEHLAINTEWPFFLAKTFKNSIFSQISEFALELAQILLMYFLLAILQQQGSYQQCHAFPPKMVQMIFARKRKMITC